ncbi:TPA: site-specific DNA-methyltransferase [Klebsiella oxytoca]|uniref:site-specific DNA-methyltransferase n=1 Tax=Klebsiella oxytoca TaxID=571 RepID=UPI000983881E|nr:site-specific DNA-methyltransferase [Klebsiella oxytoca]HBM2878336.1 site-specific DNA-methyltransferase [Klebsiella oxytoca]
MEKIIGTSPEAKSLDITTQNIEQLKQLFPEVFSEGKIDFDVLKAVLGEEIDDSDERYNFTWNGKTKARQLSQIPSTGTLRPCKEDSVNWDTTENLFIEGDNLEVLKLLQKSYHRKVKMIYIDPPYNTGKDFVYKDNFHDNIQNYLEQTGQIDSNGNKLSTNSDTSGRYHSDWLNMIYPRLKLARNLLRDDGVIFISIGDDEQSNLKKVCDDIFGEANLLGQFIWNTQGNTDNQYNVKVNHEYVIAYYKNINHSDAAIGHVIDPNTPEESNLWKGFADNNINKNNPANPPSIIELPAGFPSSESSLFYKKKDVDNEFFEIAYRDKYISDKLKKDYNLEAKSGLPVKLDDMVVENGVLVKPCRIFVGVANKNKLLEFIRNGMTEIPDENGEMISFYINVNAGVRYKKQREKARNILSVLRGFGTTEKNKTMLKKQGVYFDYPKPYQLIEYLLQIGCENEDGLVLDFFAGSSTTAHSLMRFNATDGGRRKFILVQLPEPVDPKSEAAKNGFKMISEVSKLRIKQAPKLIAEEITPKDYDAGFKVLKLDSTNIRTWDADFDNLEQVLQQAIKSIKEGRSSEDILYEIFLKYGYELTTPVETENVNGKTVYVVGAGALIVCLDDEITTETIEGIANLKAELAPETTQIVFKDEGFADDCVKTNAIQILKQAGIDDVKSI